MKKHHFCTGAQIDAIKQVSGERNWTDFRCQTALRGDNWAGRQVLETCNRDCISQFAWYTGIIPDANKCVLQSGIKTDPQQEVPGTIPQPVLGIS